MDASSKKITVAIGARLRKARLENNMTQEKLAGSEFTKGYVSALERGAVRPSLKALDVFSRRLNIPMSDFISGRSNEDTTPERESFQEDLVYRFNYARMMLRTGSGAEVLDFLASLEDEGTYFIQKLPARLGYWFPYLRGLAHMQTGDLSSAQAQLTGALALLKDGDAGASVAVRDALGAVLRQNGSPAEALQHHRECVKSIKAGKVPDTSIRLSVYNNLMDDYEALGEPQKALEVGREALGALGDATDLQEQALGYWQMAARYGSGAEWSEAKTYATRALYIMGAADSKVAASLLAVKTASLLKGDRARAEASGGEASGGEASTLLSRASELLAGTGSNEMRSRLYLQYADLARSAGDLDQAADYAARSVECSELWREAAGKAGKHAHTGALKLYAEALLSAAHIAEQQGKTGEADSLFDRALNAVRRAGLSELLSEIYYSRAQVYERRGDHKSAMLFYRQAAQAGAR